MRDKPVAENLTATKMKLEVVKKERDSYKRGLGHERFWKRKEEEYRWLIPAAELDKANS
jgi:hypothetical protein